jgi:hypothetical protein
MNKTQEFRQHHIRRALKAALAAGFPNPSVEIKLPSGATLTVGAGTMTGGPAAAAPPRTARKAPGKTQPASRRQP